VSSTRCANTKTSSDDDFLLHLDLTNFRKGDKITQETEYNTGLHEKLLLLGIFAIVFLFLFEVLS